MEKMSRDELTGRPVQVEGCILTPEGWVRGSLSFGTRIAEIRGTLVRCPTPEDDLVLPGFIDLHVHGGGGGDVMAGEGAVDTLARTHARFGTTSLLAATVTAPAADLQHALTDVGRAVRERPAGCARVLGVHLEGPYINHDMLGAQPPFARSGDIAEIRLLNALAPIRVLTFAPEIPGNLELVQSLSEEGIIAQIGHTLGTYEDGAAALEAGARGFTHLFNAMTAHHHRKPGMVGAALALAEYAEIIPDLVHVHPGAVRAALRAIPRLYCVTDSTAGTGMPDGPYQLGKQSVVKHEGGVYLEDGTLAGSTLTMDQALKNLVGLGLEVADASRRLSTYPADYLRVPDRGRLAQGCWADIVVVSPSLDLKTVYVEGESI